MTATNSTTTRTPEEQAAYNARLLEVARLVDQALDAYNARLNAEEAASQPARPTLYPQAIYREIGNMCFTFEATKGTLSISHPCKPLYIVDRVQDIVSLYTFLTSPNVARLITDMDALEQQISDERAEETAERERREDTAAGRE